MFLLDTNSRTRTLQGGRHIKARMQQHAGHLFLSVISVTEAESWLFQQPTRQAQAWFALERTLTLIDVNELIAHRAARLGNDFRRRGQRVGLADLLIAATALERGLTLVTRSMARFQLIAGLNVVDWSHP
jgi:predicted nucleic acid-binding protein